MFRLAWHCTCTFTKYWAAFCMERLISVGWLHGGTIMHVLLEVNFV